MKIAFWIVMLLYLLFLSGCSNEPVSPDVVALGVDFTWLDDQKCFDKRSPQIMVSGVPHSAQTLHVRLYDRTAKYSHGGGIVPHDGSGVIPVGALHKYMGPCPPDGSFRYELTVKAMDASGVVIGIGKKMRRWPPVEENG